MIKYNIGFYCFNNKHDIEFNKINLKPFESSDVACLFARKQLNNELKGTSPKNWVLQEIKESFIDLN